MSDLLAELFSSKVRAAVLCELLPRPHVAFSLTELSQRLAIPISSLQHECYKLERLRVLRTRREGSSRRYQVDPDGPLRPSLTALILRAIGQEAALRAAVDGVPGLDASFLARMEPAMGGPDPARLVVIGDVPLDALAALAGRAEAVLGLAPGTLELAFFRPGDWRAHRAAGHSFVAALLAAPRLPLVADDDLVPANSPPPEGG